MWFYILTFWLSLQIPILAEPFHHSAAGEYHVEWKEIGPCPPDKRGTNEIFTNIYLTRKHRKPEAVGNVTVNVTFDDTTPASGIKLIIDIETLKLSFAILGSNSAWLPNAYSITFQKGCSEGMVGMLRQGWLDYMRSFNMTAGCPMPKGFYQTDGYNVDNFLKDSIFPKTFFYGRYKVSMEYYNRKGTLLGCTYFIIDIVPLWQKKKSNNAFAVTIYMENIF